MLKKPRRLPSRFNRTVNPQTRRLVEKRHQRKRQFQWQKWKRVGYRVERQFIETRDLIVRFWIWIVAVFVAFLLGILLFSPILQVREIRIARNDPRVNILDAQENLASLFGQRLLFVSPQDLVAPLKKAQPDLQKAVVTKEFPSTLAITIVPHPIIAQLSIDDPSKKPAPAKTATGAAALGDYLTDNGMYVQYRQQQVESGAILLVLHVVDWGARPVPWTTVIDPTMLSTMHEVVLALSSQFGQKVTGRTVYLRAREFHLQVGSVMLWFDMKSTVAEQLDRYRLYLQSANGAAKEYVDLRLTDKIVYK